MNAGIRQRIWRWLALACTRHVREYVSPVWGAGGYWRLACDSCGCCHRAHRRRREKYQRLDAARALPVARVVSARPDTSYSNRT